MSSKQNIHNLFINLKSMVFNLKPSATLATHQSQTSSNSERKNIKFGFGQSPFSPPQHIHQALIDASKRKLNYYAPVTGVPGLQKAICDFQNITNAVNYKPENTIVMPGSKQGMFTVLKTFKPGAAQVFIPSPSWVSYKPQAQICSHECIYIPTSHETKWQITPAVLDKILKSNHDPKKQKILILTSPDNPTGISYSSSQIKELSQVLKENDTIVISDEIYALLNHTGEHCSMGYHYPEGTIISTGMSKAVGAGGWRLGALLIPENLSKSLKDPLVGICSEIHSCVATPIQEAAISAFDWNKDLEDHINSQRAILKKLGKWCHNKLNSPAIRVNEPDGGFYLFLDFMPIANELALKHNITNSKQLCDFIRENLGVIMLPGDQFGLEPEHLSARLAYVDFDGDNAINHLEKDYIDESFLNTNCKNVIDGVNKISNWANQFTALSEQDTTNQSQQMYSTSIKKSIGASHSACAIQ